MNQSKRAADADLIMLMIIITRDNRPTSLAKYVLRVSVRQHCAMEAVSGPHRKGYFVSEADFVIPAAYCEILSQSERLWVLHAISHAWLHNYFIYNHCDTGPST